MKADVYDLHAAIVSMYSELSFWSVVAVGVFSLQSWMLA